MSLTLRNYSISKKLKLVLLSLYFCGGGVALSAFATTYTFTGNGDWDVASNWSGNNIAPHTSGANTIIINGALTTFDFSGITISSGGTLSVNGTYLKDGGSFVNSGNITINNGGTFTFKSHGEPFEETRIFNANLITINTGGLLNNVSGHITQVGSMLVNGSFINSRPSEDGIITINGSMSNSSFLTGVSLTINNGGVVNNIYNGPFNGALIYFGCITIFNGGTFNSNGSIDVSTFTINTGGVFNNAGTVQSGGTFTNHGTIAPGPGTSPGLITISGDYNATSTTTLTMNIGGTAAAQYGRINSSGNVVLGGALNASLINGFVPSGIHNLVIITGNTVTGTFSTVNIPSGYSVQYNPTNVTLQFGSSCVPPATPTASLIQPTCDIATGTITVTAPTGMTFYTVTGTSPVVPPVTQPGLVFAGLTEGTYNVTTTSAGGCTSAPLSVILKLDKADWTGAINDNWHNAGNWSTGQVPTATTHVFILTGMPPCRIRDADAHVASIQIQSGGVLEILNGWQIVIHGNCIILPPH
jgi:hypothetical protein